MRLIRTGVLALAAAMGGFAMAQYGSTHGQHSSPSTTDQTYQSTGQGYQTTQGTQGTHGTALTSVSQDQVDAIIAGWMDKPREVARTMISKYGLPNGATPNMLVWHNNGMWKMSVLENVMIPHNFPYPHHDMLYQYIDHDVPEGLFDDLARFDGSVIAERTRGTLGARCDYEEANFLAVNLAHDIITKRRSVGEAREFYAEAAAARRDGDMNDEQRRYTSGFTFDVMEADMGDRDAEWTGTYYASMEDESYQTTDGEVVEELDRIEENRASKYVARMTGLPGRPDWGHKMGKDSWDGW
jgi:hypothetical protein